MLTRGVVLIKFAGKGEIVGIFIFNTFLLNYKYKIILMINW